MSLLPCCRDATALLTEDDESALTGAAKLKLSVHLTVCTVCRRLRSQLRATKEVLQRLAPEPPKKSDVDAILALLAAPPPDDDPG